MARRGNELIHVICLGNALHGDDGFGPAVYRQLSGLSWPADVRVFDAGAEGGVLPLFKACGTAMVIDALPPTSGGGGEILRLADYPADPMGERGTGTASILAAARRTISPMPELHVLGAVAIRCVPFHPGLSPLVAAAAETVAAMVAKELGGRARRGLSPNRGAGHDETRDQD